MTQNIHAHPYPFMDSFVKMETHTSLGVVSMATEVNLFLALGAGFLSFISPCCLLLYPAFLSYITVMSVSDLKDENGIMLKSSRRHTRFFLIGFSSIFIMLGFTTSFIGQFLFQNQDFIR